jgi:hypothetical protein
MGVNGIYSYTECETTTKVASDYTSVNDRPKCELFCDHHLKNKSNGTRFRCVDFVNFIGEIGLVVWNVCILDIFVATFQCSHRKAGSAKNGNNWNDGGVIRRRLPP